MYHITVQRVTPSHSIPVVADFKKWVKAALTNRVDSAELTIRIVDVDEMVHLNSTYRKKNKPTNVLSFPFDMPSGCEMDIPILGDIVICADVIKEEALSQHKAVKAHWAHMVVHGVLHLMGYDHEHDLDAEKMEAEEIIILKKLGFDNPYEIIKED